MRNEYYALEQSKTLTSNWGKALRSGHENYQRISVSGGVASVFNGKLLIRAPANAPDGFYLPTTDGQLKIKPMFIPLSGDYGGMRRGKHYPNIEQFNPDFATMSVRGKLSIQTLAEMKEAVDQTKSTDTMWLTPDGIYGKSSGDHMRHLVQESFDLAGVCDSFKLCPELFRIVLIELMRYDYSYLMVREFGNGACYLVFGHNWKNCVILDPEAYISDGQYI